jgi:hypothetical protein
MPEYIRRQLIGIDRLLVWVSIKPVIEGVIAQSLVIHDAPIPCFLVLLQLWLSCVQAPFSFPCLPSDASLDYMPPALYVDAGSAREERRDPFPQWPNLAVFSQQ